MTDSQVKTLREIEQGWRDAKPHSPIGPLHGAGVNDGLRWAAEDVAEWRSQAESLVREWRTQQSKNVHWRLSVKKARQECAGALAKLIGADHADH